MLRERDVERMHTNKPTVSLLYVLQHSIKIASTIHCAYRLKCKSYSKKSFIHHTKYHWPASCAEKLHLFHRKNNVNDHCCSRVLFFFPPSAQYHMVDSSTGAKDQRYTLWQRRHVLYMPSGICRHCNAQRV